jgi:hypothetical protein
MSKVEPDGFVEGLLDETREEISRADSKANILLASAGVTAAVLVGGLASGDIAFSAARGAVEILSVLAAVTLGIGIVLLGMAVMPQVGKPMQNRARYFMDHAQYNKVEDLRVAIQAERCDPDERHLAQLLMLSRIVRRKYRFTQLGEIFGGVGLVLAAAAAVLHQLL